MASIHDPNVATQLNKFIALAEYTDFEIKIASGSNQNNFFGQVYRIRVEGIRNGEKVSDHIFVKTHSDNAIRNERVKIGDKFNREALLYNDVISQFECLQKNVAKEDKLIFPKCLYADEECLVMEDLTKKSFKVIDEKSTLDMNHMKIMMSELAKLHALSFAFKLQNPESYKKFKELLKCPNIPDSQRRTFIVDKVWQWTLDAIDNVDVKNKLINRKRELTNENMIDSDFMVICHGDYNLRNVLFHYNEQRPNGLMMIDFQLSYVSSPVADIFFAIFSSTTPELRKFEYENLKNIYYTELKQYLLLLGCDAEQCYPKAVYEEDFFNFFPREFATIIVVLRLMCIAFKSNDETMNENNPARSTIMDYNCEEAERVFKSKINGVMDDFSRLGYL
ncbi:uncharacterized protein LOC143910279 isoform X2 [Arctopsyche grandis]|uniref:uncharacterized protein LOC143910279 isoform X2 n=1 Tax=Arctopsyche grandis TaxID=121162 RepID=UPI00406D77F8